MIKIKFLNSDKVSELTMDEVMEQINFGHSDEYTAYDKDEWVDGWKEWCEDITANIVSINPFSGDAVSLPVKEITNSNLVAGKYPNFHKSGSVTGMKKQYYGNGALLVKCGDFIYNVTSDFKIYFNA